MDGSLHGSARTTPQIRAELQASQETTGALARRYGLSRTTVAKWRARNARMGDHATHAHCAHAGRRRPAAAPRQDREPQQVQGV